MRQHERRVSGELDSLSASDGLRCRFRTCCSRLTHGCGEGSTGHWLVLSGDSHDGRAGTHPRRCGRSVREGHRHHSGQRVADRSEGIACATFFYEFPNKLQKPQATDMLSLMVGAIASLTASAELLFLRNYAHTHLLYE